MSTKTIRERLGLEPINIKCTDSDCHQELHCFRATRKMLKNNQRGKCRSCHKNLVNWSRVHKRDLTDTSHTIKMLKYELIRHHFWHTTIDIWAVNYARRKGKTGIKSAVDRIIRKKIGVENPPFDGRQTPNVKNPIYYAQHATATCCRKCVEVWHGIPKGRQLTEDEIRYLSELCILYINQKLSPLTENGEKVPQIRKKKPKNSNTEN